MDFEKVAISFPGQGGSGSPVGPGWATVIGEIAFAAALVGILVWIVVLIRRRQALVLSVLRCSSRSCTPSPRSRGTGKMVATACSSLRSCPCWWYRVCTQRSNAWVGPDWRCPWQLSSAWH